MTMNNKFNIAIGLITVIFLGVSANIFAGIYVTPNQFQSFQKEDAVSEAAQSARIEAVATSHNADMLELQKTLGHMDVKLGKLEATNEAILRELQRR